MRSARRESGDERSRDPRRGVALAVVLLVIALGALVGMTAVYFATAAYSSAAASARRVQGRALAWSGVQAVTAELWSQREALLRGESPRLEGEGVVFEERSETVRRGVYRLRAMGAGDEGEPEGGGWAVGEAARLDANSASAERLIAIGVSPGAADEIVSMRRARGGFSSVEEVVSVTGGMSAIGMSFDSEAPRRTPSASPGSAPPPGGPWEGGKAGGAITVFAFDPRCGSGVPRGIGAGDARVDVSRGWSRELEEAVRGGLEAAELEALKGIVGEGGEQEKDAKDKKKEEGVRGVGGVKPPGTYRELVERLAGARVSAAGMAVVLDACAVGSGAEGVPAYRIGLVDVSRASAAVLATVPGFDAESAARAVSVRRGLTSEQRAGVMWLVERQVLTMEGLAAAADYVVHRTLQWRVIVEGGIDEGGEGGGGGGGGSGGVLRDRVALEAVIDVSGPEPRVAYLRDVSLREAAGWLDERAPRALRGMGEESSAAQGGASEETVKDAPSGREAALPAEPMARPAKNAGATVPVKPSAPKDGRVGRWRSGGRSSTGGAWD